jgi:hypothetical protein
MVTRRSGLLLVERYAAVRPSAIGVDAENAMNAYRGFDGIAWPGETIRDFQLQNGLASVLELEKVLSAYTNLRDGLVDVVYFPSYDSAPPPGFFFAGYDVGYFESEYSCYSVILNEIIFGTVPELTVFGAALNESLLAPAGEVCEHLMRRRLAALASGVDLERGPAEIVSLPIYAVKRHT